MKYQRIGLWALTMLGGACTPFTSQLELRVPQTEALLQRIERGNPKFVSHGPKSVVMVAPGSWKAGAPELTLAVGVHNLSQGDIQVSEGGIRVAQNSQSQTVYTYEKWEKIEKNRAAWAIVLGTLSAVADAMTPDTTSYTYANSLGGLTTYTYSNPFKFVAADILLTDAALRLDSVAAEASAYFREQTLAPQEWYFGYVRIRRLQTFKAGDNIDIWVDVGADKHYFQLTTVKKPKH